jgi:hypothetical protein
MVLTSLQRISHQHSQPTVSITYKTRLDEMMNVLDVEISGYLNLSVSVSGLGG